MIRRKNFQLKFGIKINTDIWIEIYMMIMVREKINKRRKINKKTYISNGNKNLAFKFKVKEYKIIQMLNNLIIC